MSALSVQREPQPLSPRLQELRARAFAYDDEPPPWERGLLATQVYQEGGELPAVTLRAEVLARSLESIRPIVLPGESLLGLAFRRLRLHAGVGDFDAWRVRCLHPEQKPFDPAMPVPDEVRQSLSWWQGRTLPLWTTPARERQRWLYRYGLAHPCGLVTGHTLPDHGILLSRGLAGLRGDLAGRRAAGGTAAELTQLAAMDRCLEGLQAHARLCAATARQVDRDDPHLRAAAARCERLATEPPADLLEALQLLLWSNTADQLDNGGDAASFGRIDALLAPYVDPADDANAAEAITAFLIKKWACQSSNNLTVGGTTPTGEDLGHPLGCWILDAMSTSRVVADLSVRFHAGTPTALWEATARALRLGLGRPSCYNDDVVVPGLIRSGIAPEDARDYAPLGCVEVMLPGRSAYRTMCGGVNLTKVLELVVHGGRCAVSGDLVWDDVPPSFRRFADLQCEYERRVEQVVEACCDVISGDEAHEAPVLPRPWLTVLSRGGIAQARDLTAGQPQYDPVGVTCDGLADVTNALVALRALVFEQARVDLPTLRAVLLADWAGAEPLRQEVLTRLPRYGTDDPRADRVATAVAAHFAACWQGRRTHFGGPYWPMIFGVSTAMLRGANRRTGATAGGRRTTDDLAASLQPASAGRRGALTAVLCSAAAPDLTAFCGGVSNVQEADPAHFVGEEGLRRLIDLIRGYFASGGLELSLNFLDAETLRQAQQRPAEHVHLMVRLFGLSAQFVALDAAAQEHVLQRVTASRV